MNRDPSQRQAGKGEQLPEHPADDPLPILWATRLPVRVSNCNRRKVALRMITRRLTLCASALLFMSAAYSQAPQTLSVEPDSPRWNLQGQAKPDEYQGRKCLLLNGGLAIVKDFEMRDGVIDVPAFAGAGVLA